MTYDASRPAGNRPISGPQRAALEQAERIPDIRLTDEVRGVLRSITVTGEWADVQRARAALDRDALAQSESFRRPRRKDRS